MVSALWSGCKESSPVEQNPGSPLYPQNSYFPLKTGNKWSYTYTSVWSNMGGSEFNSFDVNWEVVGFDQISGMYDIRSRMTGPPYKTTQANFSKQSHAYGFNKVMFDTTYIIKVQIKQDTLLIFNDDLMGLSRLGPLYIKYSPASNDTLKIDNTGFFKISFIKDIGISEYIGPSEFYFGTTHYSKIKLNSYQLK